MTPLLGSDIFQVRQRHTPEGVYIDKIGTISSVLRTYVHPGYITQTISGFLVKRRPLKSRRGRFPLCYIIEVNGRWLLHQR